MCIYIILSLLARPSEVLGLLFCLYSFAFFCFMLMPLGTSMGITMRSLGASLGDTVSTLLALARGDIGHTLVFFKSECAYALGTVLDDTVLNLLVLL